MTTPGGRLVACLVLALALSSCFRQVPLPSRTPPEAQLGRCAAGIDRPRACSNWRDAVAGCRGDATDHTSFPELEPAQSCFVPVEYRAGELPRAAEAPAGCGYPRDDADRARIVAHLERQSERWLAGAESSTWLSCRLPEELREAVVRHNASVLRATARRLAGGSRRYPYAAAGTFGFGHPAQSQSALVPWRPDQPCLDLDKAEMDRLWINIVRAARAAEAWWGGVAPVVTVSGSAVHARLYEALMLLHLASCRFGVPRDAVLLDPCADHTHTNVRNTGALVIALGGRTAYVVTDDGLQAAYLQEWTAFSAIGGSIDQRALRDFGHLLGAWRQASRGISAGFWFTPYRFWADPELATFSCVIP